MNINIDTSNIDLVHNPDILALVLKSLPKAHIVHVEFFDGDTRLDPVARHYLV
jgi:hypothetical protein